MAWNVSTSNSPENNDTKYTMSPKENPAALRTEAAGAPAGTPETPGAGAPLEIEGINNPASPGGPIAADIRLGEGTAPKEAEIQTDTAAEEDTLRAASPKEAAASECPVNAVPLEKEPADHPIQSTVKEEKEAAPQPAKQKLRKTSLRRPSRLRMLAAGFMAGVIFTVGIGAVSMAGYASLIRDNPPAYQESAPGRRNGGPADRGSAFSGNQSSSPVWYGEDSLSLPASESDSAGITTAEGSSPLATQAAGSSSDPSIPDVVESVSPSVVGITSRLANGTSTGSGIIFSEDGYIVTNAHVIEGALSVQVSLSNGSGYSAQIVGSDTKSDLAVLKIDASGLPAAVFGDSDQLRVGETAIAIGNPLSLELAGTVTVGVISALNREVEIDGRYMTLLQTDAAINPGNSGGALLNRRGEVIGINSVKMASSQIEGLGFAIPSNDAVPIIRELMQNGYVSGRAALGITGSEVSPSMAFYYGIPQGILVRYVSQGSGADLAGLEAGDIITAIDGVEITSQAELSRQLDNYAAGDRAELTVYQIAKGQTKTLTIVLSEAVS